MSGFSEPDFPLPGAVAFRAVGGPAVEAGAACQRCVLPMASGAQRFSCKWLITLFGGEVECGGEKGNAGLQLTFQ